MGLFYGQRRQDGGYSPPFLHRLLKPEISGNQINGLGETEVRRPTPLYHHEGLNLPFSKLQNSFFTKVLSHAGYWRNFVTLKKLARTPYNPPADQRSEAPAEEWTKRVKELAVNGGASIVGVAPMTRNWTYGWGYPEVKEPWIVLLGMPMDYDIMTEVVKLGFSTRTGTHHIDVYTRGTLLARKLANWMRDQGWTAWGGCGPMAGPVNLIPAALAAGFGELGKHGSIINRQLGSIFRLAYVVTDLPLVADAPDQFGADDFCLNCQLCVKNCPPDAIYQEKKMIRGVNRWYVDFDKCLPYFNDSQGCGICLTVCPWSRPGRASSLARKMKRRRAEPVA